MRHKSIKRGVFRLASMLGVMAMLFCGRAAPAQNAVTPPVDEPSVNRPAEAELQALREEYRRRGGGLEPFRTGSQFDNRRANSEVSAVALSPDGRYVCTGCSNERSGWSISGIDSQKGDYATARLWDLRTGRELRRFVGHKGCWSVTSVAFSPDGRLLATCGHTMKNLIMEHLGYGEETRLWDVRTGEELAQWEKTGWSAAFTPDGKRLVVLGWNGMSVFDVASHKVVHAHQLRRPEYQTPMGCDLAPIVMPDSRSALLVFRRAVTLMDIDSGRELRRFEMPGAAERFALSGDAKQVAAIDNEGLTVWDAQTGREIRRFKPPAGEPFSQGHFVAFTPDGRMVMAVGGSGTRYAWNLETGQVAYQDHAGAGHFALSSDGRFLLRAERSHVDLIETETGIPFARFFQFEERRHWMAETIDGYYSASKEYTSFMMLDPKFDNAGLKQDAKKVTAVLSLLTRSSRDATAATSEAVPTLTLHAARVFPQAADLRIEARAPGENARITDVRLKVDGVPVLFADKGRDLGESGREPRQIFETTVRFPAGRSEVHVEAHVVDAQGRRSKPATLTLRPPVQGADVLGRLFILAVGVSEYQYKEYRLHYAHNDAAELAEFFRNQKGRVYSDVVVQVYTDAKATRDNLREGLDWLKRSCTPADGAIVLFAGHGIRGRKGLYFVTHEGDEEGIHYTCLNWSDVAQRLAETQAKQILLLSDCCHAGSFGAQRLATQDELARKIAEKAEVVFFASCRPNESSLEGKKWKHGAFTFALLEGLRGKADAGSRDGRITLGELYDYVGRRVSELTGGHQNPQIPAFDRGDADRVIAAGSPN